MNRQTARLLNKICQNTEMAKHTSSDLAQLAKGQVLRRRILRHAKVYQQLQQRANKMLAAEGRRPVQQSQLVKLAAKAQLRHKIKRSNTSQTIAKMLVKGNAMGVRNIEKAIRKNPQAHERAISLAESVRCAEAACAQQLRPFL